MQFLNNKEIIADYNENITYIQVVASILDNKTYDREIKPLKSISDNYEKIILTLDKTFVSNDNGIKILNIEDWLKE